MNLDMKKCCATWLLCAAALPAMAAEPSVTHAFRDWQASCSSIASACAAWVSDDTTEASLVVRRANVAQAGWELALHLPGLVDARTVVVSVGDLQASLQRGRDWHEGDVAGDVVLVDAGDGKGDANASSLFAAMARADVLRLAVGAPGAGPEHRFSLRGLKASLLWMDESQGKQDAWPLVQAPASMPGVSPELRKLQRHYSDDATLARIDTLPAAVRSLRTRAADCEPLAEATDGRGYQVQWLDANTALFSIACTLTPREPLDLQVVAHAPDFSDARGITFPIWDESQPPLPHPLAAPRTEAMSTLPLPVLLPVFNRLQLRQQDNHGGLEQTWRWDGRSMQLIEVRAMTLHDEAEGPWRVLWQSLAVQR